MAKFFETLMKRTIKLTFYKHAFLYPVHTKVSLTYLPSGQHQRSVSDAEEDATVPERTKPGTTSLITQLPCFIDACISRRL